MAQAQRVVENKARIVPETTTTAQKAMENLPEVLSTPGERLESTATEIGIVKPEVAPLQEIKVIPA